MSRGSRFKGRKILPNNEGTCHDRWYCTEGQVHDDIFSFAETDTGAVTLQSHKH